MNNLLPKKFKVLAIETSCDETAAAVLEGYSGKLPKFKILSSIVNSQIKIHEKTGGVVPEVAAREHIIHIMPVVSEALKQAKVNLSDIDYIAPTTGPGLIVSLVVGTEFAKGLAASLNKPVLPTNHMAGHLYAAFAQKPEKAQFPVISLIVSGGHTLLLLMKDYKTYKVIGSTVDDAVGEAYDKVAKLLNLPYPGGPQIDKLSLEGIEDYNFPRPMLKEKNYNFSFAGLKTAVLYFIKKNKIKLNPQAKANISLSFQNAAVDVLVTKTLRAAEQYGAKAIALSGGVAANKHLRNSLASACQKNKLKFLLPEFDLCTDNAQMIAIASYFDLFNGKKGVKPHTVSADPAWELK